MERMIIVTLLVIALSLALSLIALPDKNLDEPAPPITQVEPLSVPNSFIFSPDNPILLVDGPAGAVGGDHASLYA